MRLTSYRRKQFCSAVNTQKRYKLKYMKIDLHSHTYYSDGQLSPQELVDRAHNMQVDVLAITDHDSVQGLAEAKAHQASQKRPMHIVSGVELSTAWHNFDIHILGLNINEFDEQLLARLKQQSNEREERAQRIGEKLEKAGVTGILEQARRLARQGQITRAHFARAMVSSGQVKDMDSAFKKYLGKGKRAHVKPKWISVTEAVQWIHDAGGRAVLAHPGHYDMTTKWLRRLLVEFKQAGGDAMEVVHAQVSLDKKRLLTELANENGLLGSAGSDFHMPNRWTELGKNLQFPFEIQSVWHDWPIAQPGQSERQQGQI